MNIKSFALALALAPTSIAVSHADILTFTFTGPDAHTYDVSNPPPLDTVQTNAFISHDTANNTIYFYNIAVAGGIQDSVGYFQGAQLYSGPESGPTLLPGTYNLVNIANNNEDTLTITTQGVPEPSAWALMMLGFAGLGFAGWRKARRPELAAQG